jgi:NAD(P)-dependent dehydrogenase (short-subunit alcohol dehydrogenase family)
MSVVVITGCSSGFGLHTALSFARRGDRVWATMRDTSKDGELRSAAEAEGLDVEVAQLDVTEDESVQTAIKEVLGAEGTIDVLVNNAGIGLAGPIELLDDDEWRAIYETNLFGTIRTIRAALPAMREQGSGVIVNVSSLQGRIPGTPITGPYASTKHALCSLSDSLSFEVQDFGLRVRCIEPGFFATKIMDNSQTHFGEDSPYQRIEQAIDSYYRQSVGNGADPAVLPQAIIEAVEDPNIDPVHRAVGADAEMFIAGRQTMTDAQYRTWGRQLLGLE